MLTLAGSLALGARGQQPVAEPVTAAPEAVTAHEAVIKRYCVSCHNDKIKSGDLSLSSMSLANLADHTDNWEKVALKLQGRAMPPIGRPRPDAATCRTLRAHIGILRYLVSY